MTQHLAYIFVFLLACGQKNKLKEEHYANEHNSKISHSLNNDLKLSTRFNAFDTTVEVLFRRTKDSLANTQKENYLGFIEKQDLLTPEILKSIFNYYKSSYADYKRGWTIGGEISETVLKKYLPTPSTPEHLKPFITPVTIYIQNKKDCQAGTIGIEFECTWDIENSLGVLIKDWKVVETSFAQITYLD